MLDPQQQQDISPDSFFGSPDHIKRVAAIQGRASVEAEVKTNRAKLESAVQKADISPDDFFGGQGTSRQPSRVTTSPATRQPLFWNQTGDTSPIKHAPYATTTPAAMPAATSTDSPSLGQPGASFQSSYHTPTERRFNQAFMQPPKPLAPSPLKPVARVSPRAIAASVAMKNQPEPENPNWRVVEPGKPMSETDAVNVRQWNAASEREAQDEVRREAANQAISAHIGGQIGLPGLKLPRILTEGLADIAGGLESGVGAAVKGISEPGPFQPIANIPGVRDVLRATVGKAGSAMQSQGAEVSGLAGAPEGIRKDIGTGVGEVIPALAAKNPLMVGALAYTQAKGRGASEEEAIEHGLKSAATVGAMGKAANVVGRAIPGAGVGRAVTRVAGRAAANLAIPSVIEAPEKIIAGESPIPTEREVMANLPQAVGFAMMPHPVAEKPRVARAPLALPPAPPEAVTAQARGPFAVSPAGEAMSTQPVARAPRLEPIPTQPLPLNRYQQRAQGGGRIEAPKSFVTPSAKENALDKPLAQAAPRIATRPIPTVTTVKPSAPRSRSVSPESDTLLAAIQKLGFDATTAEGSDLAKYLSVKGGGRPGMVNNQRGAGGQKRGIDDLVSNLQSLGYPVEDGNHLLDLVRQEQQGKPTHSNAYDHAAAAESELQQHLSSHSEPVQQKVTSFVDGLRNHSEFAELSDKIAHGEATNEEAKRFAEIGRYELNIDPDALESFLEESANAQHPEGRSAQPGVERSESAERPPQRGAVRDAAAKEGDVDGLARTRQTTLSGVAAANDNGTGAREGVGTSGVQSQSTDNLSRVQSIFDSLKDESRTTGRRLTDLVEDRINQQPLPGMEAQGLSESDATLLRQMATRAPARAPVAEKQAPLLDTAPTVESQQAQTQEAETRQAEGAQNAPLFERKGQSKPSESEYPIARDVVDGRKVRSHIPNTDSIDATFGGTNYQELSGVREVSVSQMDQEYQPERTKRTLDLAERIKESGEIDPLIMAVDKDGPYILEGGHRYDALRILGAKSFPAKVVIEEGAKHQDAQSRGAANAPLFEGVKAEAKTNTEAARADLEQALKALERDVKPKNPARFDLMAEPVRDQISKLDAQKPILFYHGTRGAFETFDVAKAGTGKGSDHRAIWFTGNQQEATAIAEYANGAGEPSVKTAKLTWSNPLVVDAGGDVLTPAMKGKALEQAKTAGNDGVLFNNTKIVGDIKGSQAAVFDAQNIEIVTEPPHHSNFQPRDTDSGQFVEGKPVDEAKVQAFHKQLLESGKSVDQYLSQPDLFGDELTDGEREHLRELGEPARQAIAEHGQFARFLFHASERGKGDAFLNDEAVKTSLGLPKSANMTAVHNRLRAELGMETNRKVSPESLYGWAADKNLPHEAVEKIKRAEDGAIAKANSQKAVSDAVGEGTLKSDGQGGFTSMDLLNFMTAGVPKFVQQDVVPAVKGVAKTLSGSRDDLRKVFAPQNRGDDARIAANTLRDYMGKEVRGNPTLTPGQVREAALKTSLAELELRGLAGQIHNPTLVPPGWTKLDIGRRNYYAPDGVAQVINNLTGEGLAGNVALYDAYRKASNTMSMTMLGLSPFHAITTSLNSVMSKLAVSGQYLADGRPIPALKSLAETPIAPVLDIVRASKLLKEYYSPGTTDPQTAAIVEAMTTGGARATRDAFNATQYTDGMIKAMKSGNLPGAALRAPLALMEQASRPIMQYLVPRLKFAAAADMARQELARLGPNASVDATRAAMSKAWDSVDNRFGEMVHDNIFMNRVAKDILQASFLSAGWNMGTAREIGGAMIDTKAAIQNMARLKKPEFTQRMAYTAAMPIVAGMVGSTLHYLMTGQVPQSTTDVFFPQTGEDDEHGKPRRIKVPTYLNDVLSFYRDPVTTVSHKLNPFLRFSVELMNNADYHGAMIRNPEDSTVKQITDVGKFALKAYTPIGIQSIQRLSEQGASTRSKVLAAVGFSPAPRGTETTDSDIVHSAYRAANPLPPMTPLQKTKFDAKKEIETAIQRGDANTSDIIKRNVDAGLINDDEVFDIATAAHKSGEEKMVEEFKKTPSVERKLDVFMKLSKATRDKLREELEDSWADSAAKLTPHERAVLGPRVGQAVSAQ